MLSACSWERWAQFWAFVTVFFVGNRERLAGSGGGNEPPVAGLEPAKSATDPVPSKDDFPSLLCSQFTHRFCRRAVIPLWANVVGLQAELIDVLVAVRNDFL